MHILFIADPLESFKIYKDTTFSMMREAQKRGHQVTAKDLATLVRAAALLEEQGAAIDRHLSVYGQTLGELVETRHQLVSIREMLTEALEGEAV